MCVSVRTCVCVCAYVCVCLYLCVSVCTYACVYVYLISKIIIGSIKVTGYPANNFIGALLIVLF